ncbi:MAG: 3-isopropylmalate dehydrogenase [Candidatus Aenigmarchaeota archaeon]|nr:3-isopropylmalate dehydrogenase [Candidatus Aenigmarchaeota archaeon]
MAYRRQTGYSIAVIPGDGTGPEVVREAVKVLKALQSVLGGFPGSTHFDFHEYDFGGERYLRTGETLPDSAVEELRRHDAILLGAIGHPDVKPGILEKGILLKARFDLDQYINLRPVKLYPGVLCPLAGKGPGDIDFVVVRENIGGIYTGHGGVTGRGTQREIATQTMVYDRPTVDRCLRYAFEAAKKRKSYGKPGKLTLVHKTNVLTNCGDLWKRAFDDMGEQYPDITRDYNHVDACCMWMVKNPEDYDVIVTENMFGDIITDLGAIIQGGMGIVAGGNINPEGVSMFEPIGGSAPKYTGRNVINPLAAIEAGRMMLEYFGEREERRFHENGKDGDVFMNAFSGMSARIRTSMADLLSGGRLKGLSARDVEESGLGTTGIGDAIAEGVVK